MAGGADLHVRTDEPAAHAGSELIDQILVGRGPYEVREIEGRVRTNRTGCVWGGEEIDCGDGVDESQCAFERQERSERRDQRQGDVGSHASLVSRR